jgi:predicted ATP-dependent Lon-type protease
MTDPARRPSNVSRPIILSGVTHVLKFDFSAVAILEDLYDTTIKKLGKRFEKTDELRIRDVVRIVYAGLKWQHPEPTFTEETVIDLLDAAVTGGQKVGDILGEAFEAFDASAGEDDKPSGEIAAAS